MSAEHSYTITLANNKTEKRGINFVLESDPAFLLPSAAGRKQILAALGLEARFARAFDLFTLPGHTSDEREITIADAANLTLIELKTTQKYLPENPAGFFFGATQNEFDLAERLGAQFRFCFVSLHPDSLGYAILTLHELVARITTKRVQYQINVGR